MNTLAVAYGIVWLGVTLYVTWLSACQRKLEERFQALQSQLDQSAGKNESISRAA